MSCLHFFFFFNDTATTEIYTLSLHDALPICEVGRPVCRTICADPGADQAHHEWPQLQPADQPMRSEEHTSELQSRQYLVCRLLLEKKKKNRAAPRTRLSHNSHACTRS